MKIAIDPQNTSYAEAWIQACESRGLSYQLVSLYDSDLFQKLQGVNCFLSAPTLADRKTCEYAKSIIRVLEHMGMEVFPDQDSFWHYDDKVAQKYLLEAIEAQMIPSRVFYTKSEAKEWCLKEATYPFVFKLKGGAGSSNVKLIRNQSAALRRVTRMFGRGEIPVPSYFSDFRTKVKKTRSQGNWIGKAKRAPKTIWGIAMRRFFGPRERGYFYTQDFMSGNEFDTRVTIVGGRAYAYRRFVRDGDFRASGSGNMCWDHKAIDIRCIEIAQRVSRKLECICLAYDFIYSPDGAPMIVEMSYNFVADFVNACSGYWDENQSFIKSEVNVQDSILESLLRRAR